MASDLWPLWQLLCIRLLQPVQVWTTIQTDVRSAMIHSTRSHPRHSFTTLLRLEVPRGLLTARSRCLCLANHFYFGLRAGLDQIARVGSSQVDRAGVVMFTDGLDDGAIGATEWQCKQQRLQILAKAKAAGVRVSCGHLSLPKTTTSGGGLLSDIWNNIFGGSVGRMTTTVAGPELVKELAAVVLATGGTASVISSADAQISFVEQVLKNGITDNDGRCHGLEMVLSGGPVKNNVTSWPLLGQCKCCFHLLALQIQGEACGHHRPPLYR